MWNACPGPWICRTTKNSLAAWAMQQRHTYCQLVPHHWRPHAPFADLFCIIYLMPKSALQSKVHTTMPSVSLHGLAVALSAKPLEPQPVIFPAKTQLCFPRAKTNELRSAPQPKTVLNACGNGGGENACVCVHTHTRVSKCIIWRADSVVDLNSRFPLIPPPPSRLQLPGLKSNEVRVMLTGALVHSPADLIHHLWPSLHNNSVDIVKSLRCLICVTDSPRPSCVSARTHIFSPPPPVSRTLTNQPNCRTLSV